MGYRLAIGSLALILALGLFLLLHVPDVRYEETVDEFTRRTRRRTFSSHTPSAGA